MLVLMLDHWWAHWSGWGLVSVKGMGLDRESVPKLEPQLGEVTGKELGQWLAQVLEVLLGVPKEQKKG